MIFFHPTHAGNNRAAREVQISKALAVEISRLLSGSSFKTGSGNPFRVDPGFVRRKFYERAEACGLSKRLGAPEIIRKSRAVELMQSNMPLPAVQMFLGHSTPNLTTAHVTFSSDDIRQVTSFFLERESSPKTSARNSFIGKIRAIRQGDIQSQIELFTVGGQLVTTVITNDSLERLALREGKMITAEVKAPSVFLHKGDSEPTTTAENRFRGTIHRITRGRITSEYVVSIADGTKLCSVVTSESSRRLALQEADHVWVIFSSFSVVLHVD
ncbi:MAG: hypothetical protein A2511_15380 [Deltaproteobacteria bacterium RIFOXYD12_FULL_50_9]|nr:MAG: hypothetical protein A2511_15380 [Deltaproteobacteria bacterium RIFOXYD12_FULL_50_9]